MQKVQVLHAQDTPNYNEGRFNCTQAHFLLLKIVINTNVPQITPSKFEKTTFCFHYSKDEDKPYLEQPLTQTCKV